MTDVVIYSLTGHTNPTDILTLADGQALFPRVVTPQQYGAVADGVTDDSAAFVAAIAALKTAGAALTNGSVLQASAKLFVPAGNYYLGTTTLDITHTIVIEGEGSWAGAFASKLTWAANTTGIRIQRYDTSGVSSVDNVNTHIGGDVTRLKGLGLFGGYAGTEGEYHGVHTKAAIVIEDCHIENFAGDGLFAHASAGGGAPFEGNANNVRIERLGVWYCRNGIFIDGADVNIWSVAGCDISFNRQWGIWDSSFLGNSYYAIHADSNGIAGVGGGIPYTVVSNAGFRFCVKAGQEAGASTNSPPSTSTDNTWWLTMGFGGVVAGIPAWTSGMSLRAGGSYHTDDTGNANNLFSGCYHESGQGFAQHVGPTLIVGGSVRGTTRGVGCLYGSGAGTSPTGVGSVGIQGGLEITGPINGLNAVAHNFGPSSGTGDVQVSFSGMNTGPVLLFLRNSAIDGYLEYVNGVSYWNAVGGLHLRHNGNDVVTTSSSGLTMPSGMNLTLTEIAAASVPTPGASTQTLFIDTADHKLKRKDSSGTVTIIA